MLDIFALAAERLHNAKQRLHYSSMMNSSPAAEREYQLAMLELMAADEDMSRARRVVLELGLTKE